ncbi:STAS domain-containing protein [Streptomyces liliiviolaceus]|uniref:STAS domain-containing protein n=1 Tax=Streptomyces liliiviolaceus TaxID=2823109 RepID=UPI001FFD5806|nr:STAS domain-containing protein [Streptomyces liliiviolaceus]
MATSHPAQPGSLSASSTTIDGVHVVTLRGELDHTACRHAATAFAPLAGDTPARTVADFTGVTFMDSSGINMLVTAYKAATATDGWIRVAGAQPPVLHVMELVGLDTVIACYPTVDQALKH